MTKVHSRDKIITSTYGKNKPRKWVAVLLIVIFLVIARIIIMLSGDTGGEVNTETQPPEIASVEILDTKDNSVTADQIPVTINFKISSTSLSPKVALYVNDKKHTIGVMHKVSDLSSENSNYYSKRLGQHDLKMGANEAKITVTKDDMKVTEKFNINIEPSSLPVINILDTDKEGENYVITDFRDENIELKIYTTPTGDYTSGASNLSINGESVTKTDSPPLGSPFVHTVDVHPGINNYSIEAENKLGSVSRDLTIHRLTSEELAQIESDIRARAEINEAEVTCLAYARRALLVSNIKISMSDRLDYASLFRKNPDGTIVIKTRISTSPGLFHANKPLGLMECITNSDGTQVIDFFVG